MSQTLSFTCDISNLLQIEVINDFQEQLIPFLQLQLNKIQMMMKSNIQQKIISSIINLSSCYYNSYASKWEPFLEEAAFTVDL